MRAIDLFAVIDRLVGVPFRCMHRVFVEIRLKTLHLNTSKSDKHIDLFDENNFPPGSTATFPSMFEKKY